MKKQEAVRVPKATIQSKNPRQDNGDRLKDEVYRQMFRLEASRQGADLDLAMVLLRGWISSYSEPEVSQLHEWLTKISPLCLRMIETKRQESDLDQPRLQ